MPSRTARRRAPISSQREVDPATRSPQVFAAKAFTDFSMTAYLGLQFSIAAAVKNLFDVNPNMLISPNVRGKVIYSRRTNQFGTLGRLLNPLDELPMVIYRVSDMPDRSGTETTSHPLGLT